MKIRNVRPFAVIVVASLVIAACSSSSAPTASTTRAHHLAVAPPADAGTPAVDAAPDPEPTACAANGDCPDGQSCVEGTCEDDGCDDGQTSCGDDCVDTQTDRNNCGGCGAKCLVGESCQKGKCTGCPGGVVCGGALCCPTKSTCGGSTYLYGATAACVAGACQITPTTVYCPTVGKLCRATDGGAECYDACAGKACPTRKTECLSTNLLRTYYPTCSLGVCGLGGYDSYCSTFGKVCRGTAGGAECYDPCVGKTCPTRKAECLSTNLLRTYYPTCSLGTCGFGAYDSYCSTFGKKCVGGACM